MSLTSMIPWYYRWGALVLLCVAVIGTTWVKACEHQRDADELAARRADDQKVAQYQAWVSDIDRFNRGLAKQLALAKRQRQQDRTAFERRIAAATAYYRETKDAQRQPIPAAVYTVGFVRVWNDALEKGYTGTMPEASGGTAATSGGTEEVRANLNTPDVLQNAAENFNGYKDCRDDLNALIDSVEHSSPPQ